MSGLKVILLAGGVGSRFVGSEFDYVPKQALPVERSTPLMSTIRFANALGETTLVYLDSLRPIIKTIREYSKENLQFYEVPVRNLQPGPAHTALLAGGFMMDSDPVLFLDTDNYFVSRPKEANPVGDLLLKAFKDQFQSATLVVNRDLHPILQSHSPIQISQRFSRVQTEGGNRVVRHLRVKDADTYCTDINIGGYAFSRWDLFKESVFQAHAARESDELTLMNALEQVGPCRAIYMLAREWMPCGDPEMYRQTLEYLGGSYAARSSL